MLHIPDNEDKKAFDHTDEKGHDDSNLLTHSETFRALMGEASAAIGEAKPTCEPAARSCEGFAHGKLCYSTARFVHCHKPSVTAAGNREPICLAANTICPR